ncbi:T9SS type A sorting domain-containing protein [Polaribacter sp.]|nr:T9SS type A sorting domain-containing protein [Polaribacter sp.]
MKKITQNVTKSICLSGLLAFVFLFSLSINSQTAGQEYLVNPNINTTATSPDTGVDGSGNMPGKLGGWTGGNGGAYAIASTANGDCHSPDRMFKFNKVGGADGHYVYQDVEDLPAGNFNWSFWTKWGALVSWAADGDVTPTFTILTDDDADGTWEVVKTIITTQPTAANTWVEQTGIYNNQISRDVRIRFYKNGGSNTAPSNLNQTMFVDDVSLNYASAFTFPADDTSLSALTQDGTTIAGFTKSGITYDISLAQGTTVVPTIAATANNPNATAAITAATSIPGTTTILVTAEDGTTTNTVSINFSEQVAGVVGQEYLTNPNINTTATSPDTGVAGSGNMPTNLGGWGTGANGSYAPTSAGNGDCHSEDRMFKFFKKNDAYVTQTITLPAGTYDWSFWTRWAALVTWAAEGDVKPKFIVMTDDDGDDTWTAVQTTITTQPAAVNSWVKQTGTYTNDIARQVRIKFSKSGGTTDDPTNLAQLMYIDDVSLIFASTLSISKEELMSFSIYPNPATDLISISGVENINSIKVYSILGSLEKEVFNTNQIDISELSSGIHIIKVDNGTIFSKKIIKQ